MRILLLTLALAVATASTATQALKARDAEVRATVPAKGAELTPATRTKLENILTRAVDLERRQAGPAEEFPRRLQATLPESHR